MRRRFFSSVAGLAVLWAGLLWMRYHGGQPGEQVSPPRPPEKPGPSAAEKHYVTPRQLAASGAMTNRPVAPFTAVAQDGRRVAWAELSAGHPLVLVFIKRNCPCSVEFEPFFHRVEMSYRGCVRFAGGIDGPADVARRYAEANRVPYPVLADPGHRLIARFRAESGAYVALVTPGGV